MTHAEMQFAVQRIFCDVHKQFTDKQVLKEFDRASEHVQAVLAKLFDREAVS